MATRKRAAQESPRDLKHLAIHMLVSEGFLVFSNVGAKDTIDLVIGIPMFGELRTAGIRIKTSSYHEDREGWYFSESEAKYSIEKSHFFYIFCLDKKGEFKPAFAVILSKDLKAMTSTYRNGNYAIEISAKQLEHALDDKKKSKWGKYIDNFKQIRLALTD